MSQDNSLTRTLLLLTCGTNACYHVAKRLKECFGDRIRIIGADINKRWMIPTSPYLDSYHQVPMTSDGGYYKTILDICVEEHVNYLLPSFDADQLLFYKGNHDLAELGVVSLGISQSVLKIYQSKEDTNRFLLNNGFPVPHFYGIDEIKDEMEYFCKPTNGVGSAGVRKSLGSEIKKNSDSQLIIEEICIEPEITLECFNYNGKVYSVARERIAAKSGVCTKAHVYHSNSLQAIAQRFADSIELPYIFNLQFMINTEGQYVITDVNLRTAGGMSLSYAAGWDEVEALGKIILEEDDVVASVRKPVQEQFVMRAYTDIVTKRVNKRICFDLDGTLLDSRERHKVVMDHVLKESQCDIDTSDYLQYKADGNNNLRWLEMKGVDMNLAKSINQRWIDLIESNDFLKGDMLYPNALPILESLSQDNFLLLLTARNNQDNTEAQIDRLGIRQYFDKIVVVPSSKQTAILKSQILTNLKIEDFYGDTESDLEASKMANCNFYVSTRGFRSKKYWALKDVNYASFLSE